MTTKISNKNKCFLCRIFNQWVKAFSFIISKFSGESAIVVHLQFRKSFKSPFQRFDVFDWKPFLTSSKGDVAQRIRTLPTLSCDISNKKYHLPSHTFQFPSRIFCLKYETQISALLFFKLLPHPNFDTSCPNFGSKWEIRMMLSVTRWPYCVFNIWPFFSKENLPKSIQIAPNFAQNQMNLKYIAKDF